MADIDVAALNQSLEALKKVEGFDALFSKLNELTAKYKDTTAMINILNVAKKEYQEKLNEEQKKLEEIRSSQGENSDAYKDLKDKIDKAKQSMADYQAASKPDKAIEESITKTRIAFANLNKTVSGGVNMASLFSGTLSSLSSSLKVVAGGMAFLGSTTVRGLIDPTENASSTVDKMLGPTLARYNTSLRNIIQSQNVARMAALEFSSGQEKVDETLRKSEGFIKNYNQTLRLGAAATAMQVKEIGELNKATRIIPNFLRPSTQATALFSDKLKGAIQPSVLVATSLRGLGFSASEAQGKIVEMYKVFGQDTPEKFAKNIGQIAAAQRETGLSAKIVTEGITSASQAMAIFGQGVGATARVWSNFTNALRNTGVPIQNVNRMVSSLTQAIAGMSMQNRAFIGMMSGMVQGASALGGALKLELAMRSEGGLQKNLDSLTKTLSRFGGGQIITLEQAANNPQMEMQFALQRQMLGKFGVSGTEDQNRVLEALKGMQEGSVSRVDASKALRSAFEAGKSVQEKQLTFLDRIAQNTAPLLGYKIEQGVVGVDNAMRESTRQMSLSLGSITPGRAITDKGKESLTEAFRNLGGSLNKLPSTLRNLKITSVLGKNAELKIARAFSEGLATGVKKLDVNDMKAKSREVVARPDNVPQVVMNIGTQMTKEKQDNLKQTVQDWFSKNFIGQ